MNQKRLTAAEDIFTPEQCEQIDLGREHGVDPAVYAKAEYNAGQMEQLRLGLQEHLDVTPYAGPELDSVQMLYLRSVLRKGIDLKKYLEQGYTRQHLADISYGLSRGIDVTAAAGPAYSPAQLRELIYGMEEGIDITACANPLFSPAQMQQIEYGLLSGVDASDISQTSCPPEKYPHLCRIELRSAAYADLYEAMREWAGSVGMPVQERDLKSAALSGYYDREEDEIVIHRRLGDSGRLKVLCREVSHGLMHKTSTRTEEEREFEAEALSICLQAACGLEASDESKLHAARCFEKLEEGYDLEAALMRMDRAYDFVQKGLEKSLVSMGVSIKMEPEIPHRQKSDRAVSCQDTHTVQDGQAPGPDMVRRPAFKPGKWNTR